MWLLGGYGLEEDLAAINDVRHRTTVLSWIKDNLATALPSTPNLWIGANAHDPAFLQTGDVVWWRKATKTLHEAIAASIGPGKAWELIARELFILEAFPYPAKRNPYKRLPTHDYTAYLLDEWIQSGRPIIIGRAERFWRQLSPPLSKAVDSGQALRVRNVQRASISATNLENGRSDFDRVCQSLLGAGTGGRP
jgi:hypothetical protein